MADEFDFSDFENKPDDEFTQAETKTPSEIPASDFFGNAGNNFSVDEETEDKQENTEDGKTELKGKVSLGKVLSGKSAVNLVNIFLPSFIVLALNKFGYSSNKGQFKLTNEEKETLTPVVQDCLNNIQVDFENPWYTLMFVASMIYGAKIMDALPDIKKVQELPESAQVVNNNGKIVPISNEYTTPISYDKPVLDTKPDSSTLPDNPKYKEVRDKIDSTSIRKEKNKYLIELFIEEEPKDLIEMFKIYNGVFPHRNENYFRNWYDNNTELFPDNLNFSKDY